MGRIIVLGFVAVMTAGFTWPADYVEQSRADVETCADYARHTSPRFDARVRAVDPATGEVDIQHSTGDVRGELAFTKCLLAFRQWRLIERNLPKPPKPAPSDLANMAGRAPSSVIR